MNESSIATERDADLRLSMQALQRAAQRAREVARQTGTAIAISRGSVIETLRPLPAAGRRDSSTGAFLAPGQQ